MIRNYHMANDAFTVNFIPIHSYAARYNNSKSEILQESLLQN